MEVWRKSRRSHGGASNCVELAYVWRKSSRSEGGASNCVELARTPSHAAVRDSKNPTGPRLAFRPAGLAGFLAKVKSGCFG